MPINSCVKVEWKDIFLDGSTFKNTEDIPITIEIKSIDNPSLINSVVNFKYIMSNQTITKSTNDSSLITIEEQSNKMFLTTKLTPAGDLWDIPLDCEKFRVYFSVDIVTPDACELCLGSGNFYIENENK